MFPLRPLFSASLKSTLGIYVIGIDLNGFLPEIEGFLFATRREGL